MALTQATPTSVVNDANLGNIVPSSDGLPASTFIVKSLRWLMQIALWGSVASLLLGAALWGLGQLSSNGSGKGTGKAMVIGGAVGALIAGLAPTIVNELYKAAQQN